MVTCAGLKGEIENWAVGETTYNLGSPKGVLGPQ